MNTKRKRNLLLIFLVARVCFLFLDAILNKNQTAETMVFLKDYEQEELLYHNAADLETFEQEEKNPQDKDDNLEQNIANKIKQQSSNIQDIETLEFIYKKEKNPQILKEIIKKQAQNYDFYSAWNNIVKLEEKWANIDIQLFLHIFINSRNINITNKDDIQKIIPILNLGLENNTLWEQDRLFYMGLIEIRNKNYNKAFEYWQQVKIPTYSPIIISFQKSINSFDPSKAIPDYYQDWLVALTALKNWYFNIARKIALETILKDENYILPYQVLSYAHFLTNNRDTAIEYFLKLANFDKKNKEVYHFLIWASYYQKEDYSSAILYLSQNDKDKYKTDTFRYLINSYLKIDDTDKAIRTWQKLLGQSDIKNSDFYVYFYNSFYKGYFSQNPEIYRKNPSLSELFLLECEKTLGDNHNLCLYWRIGVAIVQNKLSPRDKANLVYLSENHNKSYLYHILGDFSYKEWKHQEAKTRYAQAISSSQDSKEISVIQSKLSNIE